MRLVRPGQVPSNLAVLPGRLISMVLLLAGVLALVACAGQKSGDGPSSSSAGASSKMATTQIDGEEAGAPTPGTQTPAESAAPEETVECTPDTTASLTCEALKAAIRARGLDRMTVIINVATDAFMQSATADMATDQACILNAFRSVEPAGRKFRVFSMDDLVAQLEALIDGCNQDRQRRIAAAIEQGVASANQMAESVKNSILSQAGIFPPLKYLPEIGGSCVKPDVKVILRLPAPADVAARMQAFAVDTFNQGIAILRSRGVIGVGVQIALNSRLGRKTIDTMIAGQTIEQIQSAYGVAAQSLAQSTGFPVQIEYVTGAVEASSVVVKNAQGQDALRLISSLRPDMSRGAIIGQLIGQWLGGKSCIEVRY